MKRKSHSFEAELKKIGINPYVSIPDMILGNLFKEAGKDRSPIPVKGYVNEKPFVQTLVKYAGEWRLYINLLMLANSPQRMGEIIQISIEYDPDDRTLEIHPLLKSALAKNTKARTAFEKLIPSKQKEIIRYISNLKTEDSRTKNIEKALNFLEGKGNFLGMKM